MLALRQVPVRLPASRWATWHSPRTIPRPWATVTFAACAGYALAMALVTNNELHRLWGVFAACAYLLSAMAVLVWKSRGMDVALALSLTGALAVPLALMAVHRMQQPEVSVINLSAWMLVHHGTPYLSPHVLAARHDTNLFNPYLPLMTLFGLPHAVFGVTAVTDPRIWFGVGFVTVFGAALAVAGARDVARWTGLVAASPVIAFELTVGGTDVPVLACLCLALALLWRRPRPLLAGLTLGAAAAMKATAWPAILVAAVLVGARDGRRAAGIMLTAGAAVFAAVIGPVAIIEPRALVQNTLTFPLGLASIKSAAVSPLPGRLLAETGHPGRMLAVALLGLAALAIVVSLAVRPPRTVASATWRLVMGLSLMFVLAPATRFGYFVYPVGLLAWLAISRLGQPLRGDPGHRAGELSRAGPAVAGVTAAPAPGSRPPHGCTAGPVAGAPRRVPAGHGWRPCPGQGLIVKEIKSGPAQGTV